MKAKDLMIGDWVYNPFTRKKLRLAFGRDIDLAEELCLEPIPLTAGILENNGFINYDFEHIAGQHKWSWWRDTGTLVSLWCRELNDDPRDGWMIRIESSDASCCCRVESVHELQHALRLCGIEKEIIL